MKRWLLTVVLFWCIGMGVFAAMVSIRTVSFPERIRGYLDEYDTATSLVQYLISQQIETHCKFDTLPAAYSSDYAMICLLNNVFDGSWHLFAEIGDEAVVDRKIIVIMRDSTVIHHQDRHMRDAAGFMVALIPHIERHPGEYTVHLQTVTSGQESTVTWVFHSDDLPIGED